MTSIDYGKLLRETFENALSKNRKIGDLEPVDLEALLTSNCDAPEVRKRNGIIGYPTTPLCNNISEAFADWVKTGTCPVRKLPVFDAFSDKEYMKHFLVTEKNVLESLNGLESLWSLWNREEQMYRMESIVATLGRRGLLTLLGIRKTCGSVDMWPPPLHQLIAAFDAPVSSGSALSEGARAISKHYIRDNTLKFWGDCTGNDAQKSKEAKSKLMELLNVAVWINIHELPGKLPVIELRQENGYGARWLADGSAFRGLLEPHMVDGHSVGWKH